MICARGWRPRFARVAIVGVIALWLLGEVRPSDLRSEFTRIPSDRGERVLADRGELASASCAEVATPDSGLPRAELCARQCRCTLSGRGRVIAVEVAEGVALALRACCNRWASSRCAC